MLNERRLAGGYVNAIAGGSDFVARAVGVAFAVAVDP